MRWRAWLLCVRAGVYATPLDSGALISFTPSTAEYDSAGFGAPRFRTTVSSSGALPPLTATLTAGSPTYFVGLTNGQVRQGSAHGVVMALVWRRLAFYPPGSCTCHVC